MTSNTLRLAAEERAKQGIHELEISFDGELDLHKHFNNCQKNPGHLKFIPVKKLNKYHLPNHSSVATTIAWVKRISNLTAKLSVKYVSPNRPPGYPLSRRAGQWILSVGSGYVDEMSLTENNKLPCPFKNCSDLPGEHKVRGYITIVTAAHVVFDDSEAINTTVEFFYDNPNDKSGVRTARGVKVAASSVEGDFCELLCVTHDSELCERIKYMCHLNTRNEDIFIDDVFLTTLPFVKSILLKSRTHLKFHVKTAPTNLSIAVAVIAALHTFTEEMIDSALDKWDFSKISLLDILAGTRFSEDNVLDLITFVLQSVRSADYLMRSTYRHDNASLFSGFLTTVSEKRYYLSFQQIDSLETYKNIVSLVLKDCIVFISTLQFLPAEKMFYEIHISLWSKRLKIKYINKDTITVVVTRPRRTKFTSVFEGYAQCLTNADECDSDVSESESDVSEYESHVSECESHVSECESDDIECESDVSECKPGDIECESDVSECKPDDIECKSEHKECKPDDIECKSEHNECKPNDIECKSEHKECKPDDIECKSEHKECKPDDIECNFEHKECKPDDSEYKPDDMFLVHISHPHGQSKQVTIGRQTDCFTGHGHYHQLYTAPTCPSCSGGPVWMIPVSGDLSQVYGVPHSGCVGNQLNRGCSWTIYPNF